MQRYKKRPAPVETYGAGLMSPEAPSNSVHLGGPFSTLTEAAACVSRSIRNGDIRAVRLTTLLAMAAKVGDDTRMLTPTYGFEKFMGYYGPGYQFYDHFVSRVEDMLPPPTSTDQRLVRTAVIICLNPGEKVEDITDIKEQ